MYKMTKSEASNSSIEITVESTLSNIGGSEKLLASSSDEVQSLVINFLQKAMINSAANTYLLRVSSTEKKEDAYVSVVNTHFTGCPWYDREELQDNIGGRPKKWRRSLLVLDGVGAGPVFLHQLVEHFSSVRPVFCRVCVALLNSYCRDCAIH